MPATGNGLPTNDNRKPKAENRKPKFKKWRSIAGLAPHWRQEAAGVHRRKLWQLSGFRSRAVGSQLGENGALALGKAPFSATFGSVFDDILRVFSASLPKRAQMGANLTPPSAGTAQLTAAKTVCEIPRATERQRPEGPPETIGELRKLANGHEC
jgi:hypothetical protein